MRSHASSIPLFLTRLLALVVLLVMVIPNTVLSDSMAEGQRKRNIPSWAAIEWRDRFATAQVPVIDGDLADLRAYVQELEESGGGCGLEVTDPDSDVVMTQPFEPCALIVPVQGGQYFQNGFDQNLALIAFDGDNLYLGIQTVGIVGDPDGNGNPDTDCNTNIFDEPGIGNFESYKWFIDSDCNGSPDIVVSLNNSTVTVTGITHSGTSFDFTDHGVEVLVQGVDLVPQFTARSFAGSDVDGLSEDLSQELECPPLTPTVFMTKSVEDVCAGSTTTVSINVQNTGPVPLGNVVITDMLPAGFTFAGNTTGIGAPSVVSGVATFPPITLAPSETRAITFDIGAPLECSGLHTNSATVRGLFTHPCNPEPNHEREALNEATAQFSCFQLQVTVEDGAACAGSTDELCAQVTGGTGPYTYSWTGPGGFTSSQQCITVGEGGTYTVTVTDAQDCSGTASGQLIITPAPTCEIAGPDPVCASSQGHLYTATVSPAGGSVTYAWSIAGQGTISGSTSGSSVNVNAGAAGSYTLTLNVTRDNCPGSCSKTVTVNANPTCEIAGPDPVCASSEGHVYTSSVSPPGGSVTYAWSIAGQGTISGSTSGSSVNVNAGAAGSFTLTLNVIRDNCPGSCSKTVTVSANPTCEITGPDPVCAPSEGHVYTATVSPAGGSVTYAWSISGNGTISGSTSGSSVNVNAGASGSFTLTLNVTRDNCLGSCSKTVTVSANPTCEIAGPDPVCASSQGHVYTGSVSPAGGSVTYAWSISGQGTISGSSSGSSVNVNAGAAGSYTLTLNITRDACPGSCSKTVTVSANPTCEIAGPDPVCASSQGHLYTSSVSPPGGSVTYAWSISGQGTISGSTNGSSVNVNAGAAGSFTLTLNVIRDDCPGSCSKTVTVSANPTCEIAGPDPVCASSEGHVYTGSVSPAGGSVTYAWSISGQGTISGSTSGSSVNVDAGSAGSYTLTLNITRDDCPGSCSKTVTVNANPVCVITGPNTVCEGEDEVVYTGTVTPPGGSVSYSWSVTGNGIIVGSSSGNTVIVDPTGSGSFTVNLTVIRDGCQGSCSYPVTVNPGPTCVVQGPTSVCAESDGHVYTASVNPPGGAVNYSWSVTGNGNISGSSTGSSVTVDAGAPGGYTVNLTVTRDGCTGTCSLQVTVNANPTCEIAGPDPVCASSEGHVYTGSVSPAGGSVTYAWSIAGQGTISGSTSGSSVNVNAGAAGSYTLTLNITRDTCPGSCSKTVTVNANPTCAITGPTAVCALSEGLAYAASVTPPGGSVSYSWSVTGNGSISGSNTGSSVTVNAGAAGSFTVTLNIIRDGCPGSCSLPVTVNASPVCNITGPSPVCAQSTGHVYSASVTPPGGSVTYSWSVTGNGNISGSSTGSSVTVNAGAAGSYTVNLTVTRDGCVGSCSLPVTVSPGLTVSVQSMEVCAGATAELCAVVTGGTAPYTFSWTGPGGFTSGQQCITVGVDGTYTVTVTDSPGCSGSASGELNVLPPLVVTVQNMVTCEGVPVQLCAVLPQPRPEPVNYTWTGPGGFQGTGQCVNVTIPGTYTVTVTDGRQCQGTTTATVTVETPDVEITKSAVPTETEEDSEVTIVVENTGASALSPVRVTDLLPPGLSFDAGSLQSDCNVSASTQSTSSGTLVTFTAFDLEAGETCTIRYTMDCLEFDNEARIDTAEVIAWCEGVDSENPENLDLAVTDSDTARVVCQSPFFACPHTIGFWRQQCRQQDNGSTKVCLEGMYDLWATVLNETGVVNWQTTKGQPNQSTASILAMSDADRFAALCTQLQGPRPMTNRDMAEVQYLGLMLNVAAGALPLDVPLSGSGGFSGTLADAIAGIENAINNGDNTAYWAGVADAINNNLGIQAEDCVDDIFRNQPACTGGDAASAEDSREVWLTLYPNPVFSSQTLVKYGVPETMEGQRVEIQIFDISGRLVRTLSGSHGSAGVHESVWDLRDDAGISVRSGVYFYRLRVGATEKVERLMVIRN